MKKAFVVIFLFANFFCGAQVYAQQTEQHQSPDSSNLEMAKEIVQLMHMDGFFLEVYYGLISEKLAPLVLRDNPDHTEQVEEILRNVIKGTIRKIYLSPPDKIEAAFAKAYTEEYSPEELQYLLSVYKSPVWQKMQKAEPAAAKKVIFADKDQGKIMPEIIRNLEEELKKNNLNVPKEMDGVK